MKRLKVVGAGLFLIISAMTAMADTCYLVVDPKSWYGGDRGEWKWTFTVSLYDSQNRYVREIGFARLVPRGNVIKFGFPCGTNHPDNTYLKIETVRSSHIPQKEAYPAPYDYYSICSRSFRMKPGREVEFNIDTRTMIGNKPKLLNTDDFMYYSPDCR